MSTQTFLMKIREDTFELFDGLILGHSRGNGSPQFNQMLFLKARAQHSSPTFVREYFNYKTLNLGTVYVAVGFFCFLGMGGE